MPKGVQVQVLSPAPTLNYSAYALTGGSVAYGFAVSTTCVSTTGAVAVAEGTIAANIMYSKPSKQSHKSKADNPPDLAKYYEYDPSKSTAENAKRVLDDKYGEGNWKTGSGTEYNQTKKWLTRDKGYK